MKLYYWLRFKISLIKFHFLGWKFKKKHRISRDEVIMQQVKNIPLTPEKKINPVD